MSELPTESGRLNAPIRRNFSSGETKASMLTMPLPLIAGPRFTAVVYFSLTHLETKMSISESLSAIVALKYRFPLLAIEAKNWLWTFTIGPRFFGSDHLSPWRWHIQIS